MRFHLPASHSAHDAPRAVVGGVVFTHGEADVADAHVPTVGRQLVEQYGAVRGPKPGPVKAETTKAAPSAPSAKPEPAKSESTKALVAPSAAPKRKE